MSCQPWQALVIDDILGEREDGRWAAQDCGLTVPRQNGKSVIAEVLILAGLYMLEEELIVYSAHQVPTAELVFARLVKKITDKERPEFHDRLLKVSYARGDKGIFLHSPDQVLLVKARSKESIRGFTGDRIIMDEAQMGLDELDEAAQAPTQLTRPNPQTVYMGTPPQQPGTYWGRLRARALAEDSLMCWHGWTAPKEFDPADRALWWSTNPALGTLITEEAIARLIPKLGAQFPAECCGAWPLEAGDAGWEVFTERDWLASHDPHSQIVGSVAFAIEASHDLSHLSIGAAGVRADGLRHLELVDRFPADTGRLVGWLRKRIPVWNPNAVVIDPAGPAGYLIAEVEKHCGVEVLKPLGRDVAGACGSVYVGIAGQEQAARDVRMRVTSTPYPQPRDAVERHALALAQALNDAARAAVWRDRGDARVFDRRNEQAADVAPLLAVTLASHGHGLRAGHDYDVLDSVWDPSD